MLTVHMFIHTTVGLPIELATWKGSGGTWEVAFLESTELLLLVVVVVVAQGSFSGKFRALFFCFYIIVGAFSSSH